VQKNPGLAAVLSFLFCGLGQIYNGQFGKAVAFILGAVISGLLCMVFIGFITLPAVWLWNVYDAYKSAEKINKDTTVTTAS